MPGHLHYVVLFMVLSLGTNCRAADYTKISLSNCYGGWLTLSCTYPLNLRIIDGELHRSKTASCDLRTTKCSNPISATKPVYMRSTVAKCTQQYCRIQVDWANIKCGLIYLSNYASFDYICIQDDDVSHFCSNSSKGDSSRGLLETARYPHLHPPGTTLDSQSVECRCQLQSSSDISLVINEMYMERIQELVVQTIDKLTKERGPIYITSKTVTSTSPKMAILVRSGYNGVIPGRLSIRYFASSPVTLRCSPSEISETPVILPETTPMELRTSAPSGGDWSKHTTIQSNQQPGQTYMPVASYLGVLIGLALSLLSMAILITFIIIKKKPTGCKCKRRKKAPSKKFVTHTAPTISKVDIGDPQLSLGNGQIRGQSNTGYEISEYDDDSFEEYDSDFDGDFSDRQTSETTASEDYLVPVGHTTKHSDGRQQAQVTEQCLADRKADPVTYHEYGHNGEEPIYEVIEEDCSSDSLRRRQSAAEAYIKSKEVTAMTVRERPETIDTYDVTQL